MEKIWLILATALCLAGASCHTKKSGVAHSATQTLENISTEDSTVLNLSSLFNQHLLASLEDVEINISNAPYIFSRSRHDDSASIASHGAESHVANGIHIKAKKLSLEQQTQNAVTDHTTQILNSKTNKMQNTDSTSTTQQEQETIAKPPDWTVVFIAIGTMLLVLCLIIAFFKIKVK